MREGILKAVANPPKILWGPFLPTLLNAGLQIPLMFVFLGVFNINPLVFVITIVLGHITVIALGARDPHLSGMIQAFAKNNMNSQNLYKEKGNKFAP